MILSEDDINLNFTKWVPFFSSPVLGLALGLMQGWLTGRRFLVNCPKLVFLRAWRGARLSGRDYGGAVMSVASLIT